MLEVLTVAGIQVDFRGFRKCFAHSSCIFPREFENRSKYFRKPRKSTLIVINDSDVVLDLSEAVIMTKRQQLCNPSQSIKHELIDLLKTMTHSPSDKFAFIYDYRLEMDSNNLKRRRKATLQA